MTDAAPRIIVFSSLFPSSVRPGAGLFIRERMFRVAKAIPLAVVSPVPWFPLQGLIRFWKPHFRPAPPAHERQDDIDVYFPRFLSFPGIFKFLDGIFMALGSYFLLRRLRRTFGFNHIDAHFAYPDGDAATLLGRWFGAPVTITLRGTEIPLSGYRLRRARMLLALERATRIFSVSGSLKQHVVKMGVMAGKIRVIGNGVDTRTFHPLRRIDSRKQLGLTEDCRVLVSVGGLVERKGYHRVIEVLPAIKQQFPSLVYLVVGGASPEGDWEARLKQQASDLGLEDTVHFLGVMSPDELKLPLSAADIFVLATRNEGWANVFLEAMACGLPVVTTDVGGNAEVVCRPELGIVVPFDSSQALQDAIVSALKKDWSRSTIIAYARENSWDSRVEQLTAEFRSIQAEARHTTINT